MFAHPALHLEIARQRERDLVDRAERYRLGKTSGLVETPKIMHADRSVAPVPKRETRAAEGRVGRPGQAAPQEVAMIIASPDTVPADRELAHRIDGGVEVTLLWNEAERRLAVTVNDSRSGEWFVLDAESDNALDVFYHPYAHAALQAVA
jgi:YD repeat-containing protein